MLLYEKKNNNLRHNQYCYYVSIDRWNWFTFLAPCIIVYVYVFVLFLNIYELETQNYYGNKFISFFVDINDKQ